jgi:hypothetical protein
MFDDIIIQQLDQFCPSKSMRIKENEPPWLTTEIKEAIRTRNKQHKKRQPTHLEILEKLSCKKIT